MKDKEFHKKLEVLGYPLLEAEVNFDANEVLADVVRARDLRLWEGFPLLVANSFKKSLFSYKRTKAHLKTPAKKESLDRLLLLSVALYEHLDVELALRGELKKFLPFKKEDYAAMRESLARGKTFDLAGEKMSAERLLRTFDNYFEREEEALKDLVSVKDELVLASALSQVFSPKQKELFLKKLRNEKLTKTEREYYSRVVKKKVLALANSELHKLAQKLSSSG